ncbi:MAG: ATP-binding protein [Planctomycetota bacterium]
MTIAAPEPSVARSRSWYRENDASLERELARLRQTLRRRQAQLRAEWQHDPLASRRAGIVSDAEAEWLSREPNDEPPEVLAWPGLEGGSAFDGLACAAGLTPFERSALFTALAPSLDPRLALLYGYLQDDPGLSYATPELALTLFAGQARPLARDSFLPAAPLRSLGLVRLGRARVGTGVLLRPLEVPTRIVDHVRGVDRADAELGGLARVVDVPSAPPGHEVLAERAARGLRAESPARARLVLLGPEGSGREAAAGVVCARLGWQLLRLGPEGLDQIVEWPHAVGALLAREHLLGRVALYVELPRERSARCLTALDRVAAFECPVIFGTPAVIAGRAIPTVALRKPDASEQRYLWRCALGPELRDVDALSVELAERFELGPTDIDAVARSARAKAQLAGSADGPGEQHLREACREHAGVDGLPLGTLLRPSACWSDLVLPADAMDELREIGAHVRHRTTVFSDWGFGARACRGRGVAVLFAGPSGTGKTLAAEILATELGSDLFQADLSTIVNKYVGETEKHLAQVFRAAERGGVTLFFDEAEALFGRRTEVQESRDRLSNLEIDFLLQRIEQYRGLVVLATNRKGDLDPAFLRRLRFSVDFPFPDRGLRRKLWRHMFPRSAPVDHLDWDRLAAFELAGGNIRNAALRAAFRAADAGGAVTMSLVLGAVEKEYRKLGFAVARSLFANGGAQA